MDKDNLTLILMHIFIITLIFVLPLVVLPWFFGALYVYGLYYNFFVKKHEDAANIEEKATEIAKQKQKDDPTEGTPWWVILGTTKTASPETCKKLRNALTRIYHPDGGECPSEIAMQRLNYAYEKAVGRL